MIDSLVYYYRSWRYRTKPAPRIDVTARFLVPAQVVRMVCAFCMGACTGLAADCAGAPAGMAWTVVAVLCAWALVAPCYQGSMVAIAVAAIFLLFSPGAPFNPSTPWIVLTGYVSLRLSLACALLPWNGKAELRALLTHRDLVVLALTAVIGCAVLLPGSGSWVVLLGTTALILLAVVIVATSRKR